MIAALDPIDRMFQAEACERVASGLKVAARYRNGRRDIRIAARFFDFIDRRGGRWRCWPWLGSRTPGGYGVTTIRDRGRKRTVAAYRVAYYLDTGFWEDRASGRLVRHLCHNPWCCNSRHLLAGSSADNRWDEYMRKSGVDLVAVRRALEEAAA